MGIRQFQTGSAGFPLNGESLTSGTGVFKIKRGSSVDFLVGTTVGEGVMLAVAVGEGVGEAQIYTDVLVGGAWLSTITVRSAV